MLLNYVRKYFCVQRFNHRRALLLTKMPVAQYIYHTKQKRSAMSKIIKIARAVRRCSFAGYTHHRFNRTLQLTYIYDAIFEILMRFGVWHTLPRMNAKSVVCTSHAHHRRRFSRLLDGIEIVYR